MSVAPLMRAEGLDSFYGSSQALFRVSLKIDEGEVVTLLGRNGMGKTTTIRSLLGLAPRCEGEIWFAGSRISGLPSFRIARRGIGLVPEGRQVFPNLTVRENLIATARVAAHLLSPWTLDRIYALFPGLAAREASLGRTLSGGEQQMLAIGRALMTNPKLLVLDEATEGLAPLVRREIWRCLAELKAAGQSILLVDKNLRELAAVADRHYVLEKGRVVWEGNSAALLEDGEIGRRHLGAGMIATSRELGATR